MLPRRLFIVSTLLSGASAFGAAKLLSEQSKGGTHLHWLSDLQPLNSDNSGISAHIEDNGWVIAITGVWTISRFESLDFDPEGQPKLIVQVRSSGFKQSADGIYESTKMRRIIGTVPLRVSRPGPPMDVTSLDEEQLPDGRRRIRIALDQYIYADDEIVDIILADGWRLGHHGEHIRQVTNLSAVEPELPSMRWIVPTLKRVTLEHSVPLELIVASGLSEGTLAVAGIRFVASDGVRENFRWVLSPSFSQGWGDELRVWGIDAAALCEGLDAGPVTVHAEICPWIGRMRSTGRGHATRIEPSLGYGAEKPLMVLWDPYGEHMPEAHVYVSGQGTTNPSAVTVATSLETARSGQHAANLSVAAQAIFLANRTIPAANGWPASTRAGDNAIITLGEGVHNFGTTATSSGAMTAQGRLIVRGDPELARGAAALSLGQRPTWRYRMLEVRNSALLIGGAQFPLTSAIVHFQNMDMRARPGQEASVAAPFAGSDTEVRLSMSGCTWQDTAIHLRSTGMRCAFIRSTELGQSATSPVIVGCLHRGLRTGSFQIGMFVVPGAPEATDDSFLWSNRVYGVIRRPLLLTGYQANPGRPHLTMRRFRIVNNLFEICVPAGSSYNGTGSLPASEKFFAIGENSWGNATDWLLEGNSFVGQRSSTCYNDPPTNDPAMQLAHHGNVIRNNFFDRNSTKQDDFMSPRYGRRPGFTESWSAYYGVTRQSNVTSNRMGGSSSFPHAYYGSKDLVHPMQQGRPGNDWTRFADDRSQLGLSAYGDSHGNYQPLAGSPLLGRASSATIDVDALGKLRGSQFAAGAFESSAALGS